MPGIRPRDLRENEPMSASWLNQLVAFVEANQITIAPDSGLTGSSGVNGLTIGLQETPMIPIRLTYASTASGSIGSYSWIEQVAAYGGGWTDGDRKGYAQADPARGSVPADPAWESGYNGSLPAGGAGTGYIVDAATRDEAVGRLTFRAGTCPS